MILKASQRGGGQNLAVHLMRTDDNEHVRVHELRGLPMADGRKRARQRFCVPLERRPIRKLVDVLYHNLRISCGDYALDSPQKQEFSPQTMR